MTTVLAGFFRLADHWQKVTVLGILQHFGELSGRPKFIAFGIRLANAFKAGVLQLIDIFFRHGFGGLGLKDLSNGNATCKAGGDCPIREPNYQRKLQKFIG
jgi:hypothetical protein